MEIIIFLISIGIVLVAQAIVTGSYFRYSKKLNLRQISGYEAARTILDRNGLEATSIVEISGKMSDHYNPANNIVSLSKEVYNGKTIASIAIAAHECGHVIQHKDAYKPMIIRNSILPVVGFASYMGYIVVVIGLIASALNIAMFGIILLCIALLFQIITLPIEFNASNRAIEKILEYNIADIKEKGKVKSMLGAAAFTYVASLLAGLLQILRLFLMANRRN